MAEPGSGGFWSEPAPRRLPINDSAAAHRTAADRVIAFMGDREASRGQRALEPAAGSESSYPYSLGHGRAAAARAAYLESQQHEQELPPASPFAALSAGGSMAGTEPSAPSWPTMALDTDAANPQAASLQLRQAQHDRVEAMQQHMDALGQEDWQRMVERQLLELGESLLYIYLQVPCMGCWWVVSPGTEPCKWCRGRAAGAAAAAGGVRSCQAHGSTSHPGACRHFSCSASTGLTNVAWLVS